MNDFEKTRLIDGVTSEMCDKYCKWPSAPVPEGKTEHWLYEDGSPCDNCPLERLEALKK